MKHHPRHCAGWIFDLLVFRGEVAEGFVYLCRRSNVSYIDVVCPECDIRVSTMTGHTGAVFTLDVTSAQWLSVADVAWQLNMTHVTHLTTKTARLHLYSSVVQLMGR